MARCKPVARSALGVPPFDELSDPTVVSIIDAARGAVEAGGMQLSGNFTAAGQ